MAWKWLLDGDDGGGGGDDGDRDVADDFNEQNHSFNEPRESGVLG